ncbi:sensor histidine kinase [Cellulomonas cellasea]|uniref:histidine kinase n=1 Tax=Cellulomonas cellasea TaxID=43670 RepID=A0A4Y3KU89_9CELL|nr:histidine kinase [Cellulomonas cellasea]GEA86520.1 hypothetical protein CCE01nite_04690 [Cellulomonas cellasea]
MTTSAATVAPPARPRALRRERVPSLAAAALVAAFLLVTPTAYGAWVDRGGELTWEVVNPGLAGPFPVIAGATVVAGVLLGRRNPGWGTVLTLLPFLGLPWMGSWVWGWWLGMLAVAALAALDGLGRAVVPTLASVLVVVAYCGTEVPAQLPIGPVTSGTGTGYETPVLVTYLIAIAAVVGVAAAAGSAERSRRREADARVVERQALEVESLAGERARLARDLHDVVAHHVSLVAVRAESAPFVHPGLDDEARAVLAAIAVDAREALTELRQVLVVLQRTGAEGERAPQPTACDVDELVASAVAAGQPVTVEGGWHDVAAGPGYVLYRAVQEGLTNARRHAPGTTTTLVRSQHGGTARFRLTNPADAAGPTGRGLIGMRERVEALGGTVSAGVVDGQFVLDVAVPAGAPAASGDRSVAGSDGPDHRATGRGERGWGATGVATADHHAAVPPAPAPAAAPDERTAPPAGRAAPPAGRADAGGHA